jgi:hypothetical protein
MILIRFLRLALGLAPLLERGAEKVLWNSVQDSGHRSQDTLEQ